MDFHSIFLHQLGSYVHPNNTIFLWNKRQMQTNAIQEELDL